MAYRVSEKVMEFDRRLAADLMQAPITNRERLTVVCRALHEAVETELTPRQREVIVMRYFEKRSGKEIAEILGLNPSTVCRIRQRAEQRLQHALRFYVAYLNCSLGEP